MVKAIVTMVLFAALPLIGGCEGRGGSSSPVEPPFPGSVASLESLGALVLDGLTRSDTALLEKVRLTEQEHNEVVWPELPAARPEANFPVELAWDNIQQRNRRDRARALRWFSGRELGLSAVECRGGVERFRTFEVLTDCHLVFRTEDGSLLEARVFKDVLVRRGGYKIFRYYDDPPEPHGSRGGGAVAGGNHS